MIIYYQGKPPKKYLCILIISTIFVTCDRYVLQTSQILYAQKYWCISNPLLALKP
ncbi:hypothetical protein M23134_01096 [Microscilla marina ATCC 23134]|uniref:Uncharacterized protein n=1 Tax=Microscilla marina ATCC 23134 TaxID=313606 RepID=A1ZFJ8_MICM2|nr:hypothetical protein M23134_01096 [Microscilla marina ATCC 23134]